MRADRARSSSSHARIRFSSFSTAFRCMRMWSVIQSPFQPWILPCLGFQSSRSFSSQALALLLWKAIFFSAWALRFSRSLVRRSRRTRSFFRVFLSAAHRRGGPDRRSSIHSLARFLAKEGVRGRCLAMGRGRRFKNLLHSLSSSGGNQERKRRHESSALFLWKRGPRDPSIPAERKRKGPFPLSLPASSRIFFQSRAWSPRAQAQAISSRSFRRAGPSFACVGLLRGGRAGLPGTQAKGIASRRIPGRTEMGRAGGRSPRPGKGAWGGLPLRKGGRGRSFFSGTEFIWASFVLLLLPFRVPSFRGGHGNSGRGRPVGS